MGFWFRLPISQLTYTAKDRQSIQSRGDLEGAGHFKIIGGCMFFYKQAILKLPPRCFLSMHFTCALHLKANLFSSNF